MHILRCEYTHLKHAYVRFEHSYSLRLHPSPRIRKIIMIFFYFFEKKNDNVLIIRIAQFDDFPRMLQFHLTHKSLGLG